MKSYLENRFSMMRTVVETCDSAGAVISSVPALWTTYQSFKAKVSEIEVVIQEQVTNIEGMAAAKKASRKKLIGRVILAAGMLRAYATSVQDLELRYKVRVSRSGLMRMRDEVMYGAAKGIIDLAVGLQVQMGPFGLTPALLASMQDALDDYHSKIEKPAVVRNARKMYTALLNSLISEALELLRFGMDGHMEVLADNNEKFVKLYKNSRMIYDYRAGRRKRVEDDMEKGMISGSVADGDGLPIMDALVKLDGTSMSCMTDEEGEFMIDNIPAGSYNLVVVMDGYKEKWENGLLIDGGEEVSRDFVMETEET